MNKKANAHDLSYDWRNIIHDLANKPCTNSIWSIQRRMGLASIVCISCLNGKNSQILYSRKEGLLCATFNNYGEYQNAFNEHQNEEDCSGNYSGQNMGYTL